MSGKKNFLGSLLASATDLVAQAQDVISNKTELEKKLDAALSKENWGASATQLREIAAATNHHADFPVVMRAVWVGMDHAGKNWRQVYKSLVLLEALLKHGSERVVNDAREHVFRVRTLTDYSHFDGGKDQGSGIREMSKRIVALLGSDAALRDERRKAKELISKYVGVTNDGGSSSGFSGGGNDGGRASLRVDDGAWVGSGLSQQHVSRGDASGDDVSFSGNGGGVGGTAEDPWRVSVSQSSGGGGVDMASRHAARVASVQARRGRKHITAAEEVVPAERVQTQPATNSVASASEQFGSSDFNAFGSSSAAHLSSHAQGGSQRVLLEGGSPFADFAPFDVLAPVAAPALVPSLSAPPRLLVTVRGGGAAAPLQVRASAAPAAALKPATDDFDPFIVAQPPQQPLNQPQVAELDFFSAPAHPPASAAPHLSDSASFDPFSTTPAPPPAAAQTSFSASVHNPFAQPSAVLSGVSVGNDASFGGDGFGTFSSAGAPVDADVDRLVALDRMSLSDACSSVTALPAKAPAGAPLRTLGKSGAAGVHAVSSGSSMMSSSYAAGRGASISAFAHGLGASGQMSVTAGQVHQPRATSGGSNFAVAFDPFA